MHIYIYRHVYTYIYIYIYIYDYIPRYWKTRTETEKNQLTKWKKEQDDIKHLQDFIRSCGTFANLRIQAESKQKIIDKMTEARKKSKRPTRAKRQEQSRQHIYTTWNHTRVKQHNNNTAA